MKLKKEILLKLSLLVFTTILFNCISKHNAPSYEEIQLSKLNATWNTTSVMKDGASQLGYDNLKLTISGASSSKTYIYAVTGRPAKSPWPSGGSWTFGSNVMTQLIRDKGTLDELPISYSITSNTLTLQFQFSGVGYVGGKVGEASGNWSFVFTR
jgi:hypothetical protein